MRSVKDYLRNHTNIVNVNKKSVFLFTCWFIIAEKDRCVKMEVLVGAHDVEYDDKYGDHDHDECALVICWSWWWGEYQYDDDMK